MLKRWFLIVCIALVSLTAGIAIYGVMMAKGGGAVDTSQETKQTVINEAKMEKSIAATKEETMEREILDLVNQERAKVGKDPLKWNERLHKVAAIRVEEIVSKFSHERPDGTQCFTAFDQAGASYWYAAENLAMGQISSESVMEDWMNSPGHKKNILGEGESFGCAVIKNPKGQGYCFAQEFGTLK